MKERIAASSLWMFAAALRADLKLEPTVPGDLPCKKHRVFRTAVLRGSWLRSSNGRAPGSYPGGCRFDACRGHHVGRTATGAVSRFENGWAGRPWGFDSLSFRF